MNDRDQLHAQLGRERGTPCFVCCAWCATYFWTPEELVERHIEALNWLGIDTIEGHDDNAERIRRCPECSGDLYGDDI